MNEALVKWWEEEGKRIPTMGGSEVAAGIIACHAFYAGVKAATPQWQPIETAPKDLKKAICTDGKDVEQCRYHEEHGWWYRCDIGSVHYMKPTHWQPLPELPTS